jgi:uncharacterized protein DUF6244
MTGWGTTAISRELAGATTGFTKALTGLTEAADYADRAAARMLPGFPGIAHSFGQIKDAILANHRDVTELADALPPLPRAVDAVTDDSTPAEVVAALTPIAAELARLPRATLYAANQQLGDTELLIRRLLQGGSPEHLQAHVERSRSILAAVHTRLTKAKAATDAVLSAAREAGDVEQTDVGDSEPPVPAGELTPPAHVRRAAARLSARRMDEESDALGEPRMATEGVATNDDTDHEPIGDVLTSGRGPGSRGAGLNRRIRWGNSLDHVGIAYGRPDARRAPIAACATSRSFSTTDHAAPISACSTPRQVRGNRADTPVTSCYR